MTQDRPTRRRKTYSPSQVAGLRVAGAILKLARLENAELKKPSLRQHSAWLLANHGENFNHSRIDAFEKAGTKMDSRPEAPAVSVIHPNYLKVMAPYTAYSFSELKEIADGNTVKLVEDLNMEPLSILIEQRQKELGRIKFFKKARELELTESDIDSAKLGEVPNTHIAVALSALLEIPADEVKLAAIAQLVTRVKQDPDS